MIEYFQWHQSSPLYKAIYSVVASSDISFLYYATFYSHVTSTHCYLFCPLESQRVKVLDRCSINICWMIEIIIRLFTGRGHILFLEFKIKMKREKKHWSLSVYTHTCSRIPLHLTIPDFWLLFLFLLYIYLLVLIWIQKSYFL